MHYIQWSSIFKSPSFMEKIMAGKVIGEMIGNKLLLIKDF